MSVSPDEKPPWCAGEKAYLEYLACETHMFAWCLITHGGIPLSAARAEAEQFYAYESATEPFRGIIFHDEAWHWAMLKLFGERYWMSHPELESPSTDYRVESHRLLSDEKTE
jgi:hypothetical protein